MGRSNITLSPEEKQTLEAWVRATTTEQRIAMRARIILALSGGVSGAVVARRLEVRPSTGSRWGRRFLAHRLPGLQDRVRPGPKVVYGPAAERRLLEKLDDPPPKGYASWNGRLVAQATDLPPRWVWRVLRKHGIQLQRRRTWCQSTDPEFARKAADIIGLYLAPPENAVVFCVDEKPQIQALERAQGWLRLPNGRALTGHSHQYKRHGTTTLFAALDIVTGQIRAGHYKRRRRREFLDFMNELINDYPNDIEIHVILDNLNTHKPKHDRWLARHPNVFFHFTPTRASWLNQIEIWFSILSRATLRGASFTDPLQIRRAIDDFVEVYNQDAAPFEWRKESVHQVPLKKRYADLCH